jgi:hypothetical protein
MMELLNIHVRQVRLCPAYRPYEVVLSSEQVERLFKKVLEEIPVDP